MTRGSSERGVKPSRYTIRDLTLVLPFGVRLLIQRHNHPSVVKETSRCYGDERRFSGTWVLVVAVSVTRSSFPSACHPL